MKMRAAILIVVLALAVAACGSNEPKAKPVDATPVASTEPPPATTADVPPPSPAEARSAPEAPELLEL